jgi:uncharacterized protein YbjT (DUF2867 family)
MFTVMGVSGNTGGAAARALLAQGRKVRVVVRDARKGDLWRARGAEVAIGSLADAASIEAALRGAEGAYLLFPPDIASEEVSAQRRIWAEHYIKALQRTKVPRVVVLSSHAGDIFGEYEAEEMMREIRGITFLRPSYFLENWADLLPAARNDGVLPSFHRVDVKEAMISAEDVGATAARLLAETFIQPMVEVTGPEDVSPNDIAAALSTILGRKVKALPLSNDQVVPTFTGMGVSKDYSEMFRKYYARAQAGGLHWERPESLVRGQVTLSAALRKMLEAASAPVRSAG